MRAKDRADIEFPTTLRSVKRKPTLIRPKLRERRWRMHRIGNDSLTATGDGPLFQLPRRKALIAPARALSIAPATLLRETPSTSPIPDGGLPRAHSLAMASIIACPSD
jgi:hypothetical protein